MTKIIFLQKKKTKSKKWTAMKLLEQSDYHKEVTKNVAQLYDKEIILVISDIAKKSIEERIKS